MAMFDPLEGTPDGRRVMKNLLRVFERAVQLRASQLAVAEGGNLFSKENLYSAANGLTVGVDFTLAECTDLDMKQEEQVWSFVPQAAVPGVQPPGVHPPPPGFHPEVHPHGGLPPPVFHPAGLEPTTKRPRLQAPATLSAPSGAATAVLPANTGEASGSGAATLPGTTSATTSGKQEEEELTMEQIFGGDGGDA